MLYHYFVWKMVITSLKIKKKKKEKMMMRRLKKKSGKTSLKMYH